jgi:hypothetical protein
VQGPDFIAKSELECGNISVEGYRAVLHVLRKAGPLRCDLRK